MNYLTNQNELSDVTNINNTLNAGFGYKNGYTMYDSYYEYYMQHIEDISTALMCDNKNDRFTKDDVSIGNGALSSKIGLITTKEAFLAGASTDVYSGTNPFIVKNFRYWTMTPAMYKPIYDGDMSENAIVGSISNHMVWPPYYTSNVSDSDMYVVPVINIKYSALVNMTGTGTQADPFIVE